VAHRLLNRPFRLLLVVVIDKKKRTGAGNELSRTIQSACGEVRHYGGRSAKSGIEIDLPAHGSGLFAPGRTCAEKQRRFRNSGNRYRSVSPFELIFFGGWVLAALLAVYATYRLLRHWRGSGKDLAVCLRLAARALLARPKLGTDVLICRINCPKLDWGSGGIQIVGLPWTNRFPCLTHP